MPTHKFLTPVTQVVVCLSVLSLGCAGGPYARTGAAMGGLTGGVVGAAAGAQSGKSLQGAAVGALAGTVLGGAVGDSADREVEAIQGQQMAWQQQQRAKAVTLDQVIQMTQSGIGDQVIANQIRAQGVLGPLSTDDLVFLKQNGVSDTVITAWQQTPSAGDDPVEYVRPSRPIIVQERWIEPRFGPDCFYYGPPRRAYHRHGAEFHLNF